MATTLQSKPIGKASRWRKQLLVGILVLAALLLLGASWVTLRTPETREAPEAEAILRAQSAMPFQVLIPAYLPPAFERKEVEIQTDQLGPQGEAMVRLIYTTRQGIKLALSEWVPRDLVTSGQPAGQVANASAGAMPCHCMCRDQNVCSTGSSQLMIDVGPLRTMAETSDPQILSRAYLQTILSTLAPASGLLIYSSLKEVPSTYTMPPAVQIPVNSQGVQEVVLVVSSSGYTPVHFAVKRDIPVRLVFRQLGYVGCGNELAIQWGQRQQGHLLLASPIDTRVLEFIPHELGDFPFNCPHRIYEGVMTVAE